MISIIAPEEVKQTRNLFTIAHRIYLVREEGQILSSGEFLFSVPSLCVSVFSAPENG